MWYNTFMESATFKAYAKINLSLDVTGTRGGYHTIDSVVASVDLFDLIEITPRTDGDFAVTMRGEGSEAIAEGDNNALKAARAFSHAFGCGGADISIQKHIPMGAGLGGSSADVAGVLNALALACGVNDRRALKDIADSLGSDCGYMLTGGYARITGRGERVCPLASDMRLCLLLLLPPGGVSTAKCYALSDVYPEKRRTSNAVRSAICAGQLGELCSSLSNGLYPAAAVIEPDIRVAAAELEDLGALAVNMTGSGSCVYGIFPNDAALSAAAKAYRGRMRAITAHTIPGIKV